MFLMPCGLASAGLGAASPRIENIMLVGNALSAFPTSIIFSMNAADASKQEKYKILKYIMQTHCV
jgi:hypothetical protein